MTEIKIRMAQSSDIDNLVHLDTVAFRDASRADSIRRWVESGECYLAEHAEQIVGYGVLNYEFFHLGNVDMLMIHPGFRGQGIGRKLLHYLYSLCKTEKFWCTTNLSNQRMQRLLASEGFKLSGFVDDLDEGDPELIFIKRLERLAR
ncbi:MAG: GNAT family N-acetyltransferase [Chloroflexi bacterium]|nr:GNAT family N-acetyltransferase [Chloroflexota bacterium]